MLHVKIKVQSVMAVRRRQIKLVKKEKKNQKPVFPELEVKVPKKKKKKKIV